MASPRLGSGFGPSALIDRFGAFSTRGERCDVVEPVDLVARDALGNRLVVPDARFFRSSGTSVSAASTFFPGSAVRASFHVNIEPRGERETLKSPGQTRLPRAQSGSMERPCAPDEPYFFFFAFFFFDFLKPTLPELVP